MAREQEALERRAPAAGAERERPVFVPATDVYEKADALLVLCDMPGVDEKNVEVTLDNGVLTIVGQQDPQPPQGYRLIHRGYETGIFRRAFRVTPDIDASRISAKMSQGVLRLVLPKAEHARPRRIAVTSGD